MTSPQLIPQRVGPPVLLGLRPKFIDRAMKVAQQDERIRAISLWGALARGEADEWDGVDFIVSVADELVPTIAAELTPKDTLYGQSLITLAMPQNGVDGGDFLSVTYFQSSLPLRVNWYICPLSLGLSVADTKTLLTREPWPESRTLFAELLAERPSRQSNSTSEWDVVVVSILAQITEVVRGRPEAVVKDGNPLNDSIAAYDELAERIAALPASHSDLRAPLFYHLGIARRGC